jgi:uncharacterized protein
MIALCDGTMHEFNKPFVPNIETIASSLANINRFNGHVGQYSVAQHCVMISMKLPPELKLSGLLHDAPEAYIGDVSAPLKRLLPDYRDIEQFYHDQIDRHFGVQTQHPIVKEYDIRMLAYEGLVFGLNTDEFPKVEPLYEGAIQRWSWNNARIAFLETYKRLIKSNASYEPAPPVNPNC